MTQRQRVLPLPQDPNDIRTSSDFLTYVENQKIAAQRRVDDLKGSITELVTTSARLKADYESAVHANNVLIAGAQMEIDDAQAVISAAERALDFGRVPGVTQQERTEE